MTHWQEDTGGRSRTRYVQLGAAFDGYTIVARERRVLVLVGHLVGISPQGRAPSQSFQS